MQGDTVRWRVDVKRSCLLSSIGMQIGSTPRVRPSKSQPPCYYPQVGLFGFSESCDLSQSVLHEDLFSYSFHAMIRVISIVHGRNLLSIVDPVEVCSARLCSIIESQASRVYMRVRVECPLPPASS